jgi:hypothetical protein
MNRFKRLSLCTLAVATCSPVVADFLNSELSLHPAVPQYRPFVLELQGTWAGSCHPGLGTPVITSVNGLDIVIELELDPLPPCLPEVPSPYRVLVDMSQAFDIQDIDPLPASDLLLNVTVNFLGHTLTATPLLGCFGPAACPLSFFDDQVLPDPGLFQGQGLLKQGLLLARQGGSLAAYPLTYDENGNTEWLFAGDGVYGDTYFASLYQASGGQCLGCPPPDEPPVLDPIGRIAMVFDSEGVAQVKIDDGPFTQYRALDYGYGQVPWYPIVPNLEGRWALVEPGGDFLTTGGFPPGSVLPLVFDIELVASPTGPVGPEPVVFELSDPYGDFQTTIACDADNWNGPLPCVHNNPDFEEGSFSIKLLSPERIRLTYGGLVVGVGSRATGVAVRID